MKIPTLPRKSPSAQGFTLIELLVVISIIAILAGFAMPAFTNAQKKARITESMSNVRQIALALKGYALGHEGSFPYYTNVDDPSTKVTTSNAAFELMMPAQIQTKTVFATKTSAWCKGTTTGATDTSNQYKLLAGQCDWSYVAGLNETSDPRWPVVATAFADSTGTYKKSNSQKGGVWGATDAVVLFVDGSAKIMSDLYNSGQDGAYVKRPDKPTANMFVADKEGAWLDGDSVAILMPIPPGN